MASVLVAIIVYTGIYVISAQNHTPDVPSEIISMEIVSESEETVQADIIYYDKTW